jgi:hypothetical protein
MNHQSSTARQVAITSRKRASPPDSVRASWISSIDRSFFPDFLARSADVENAEQKFLLVVYSPAKEAIMGRGILLWLIGVPIPVIILLALVFHH